MNFKLLSYVLMMYDTHQTVDPTKNTYMQRMAIVQMHTFTQVKNLNSSPNRVSQWVSINYYYRCGGDAIMRVDRICSTGHDSNYSTGQTLRTS